MRKLRLLFSLVATLVFLGCKRPPDEIMYKQYSQQEIENSICSKEKKCVNLKNEIWFLDQGWLFIFDKTKKVKKYADGFEVKEIVSYKGLVVALQLDGDIFLAAKDEDGGNSWIKLGNSTKKIESDDKNLIALTSKNEVWAYQGEPGDVAITYAATPILISCGKGCMSTVIVMSPLINGREVAFENTNIDNAYDIKKTQDGILINTSEGEHIFD